ncbi:MAG: SWIM zinc finger family protein [Thermodesulfovibrionales bacterium]|nr:SWIM zinc finger family protein [Thermodesulfovibrionales bacterium]
MEEIYFLVQGSADEPYKVTFQKKGNNLSAYCTCPAGENGQCCKHRFRIFAGSDEGIVSGNKDEVIIVKSWLSGTDVEAALGEVVEKEKVSEKAKKDLSAAKKKLVRIMMD